MNPPSLAGQDVWYSPNVFINKVQVALWQPAHPIDTALKNIPIIASPSQSFNASQQSIINASVSSGTLEGGVSQTEGDGISPDAAAGQTTGPTTELVNPEALAGGTSSYTALLNNLNTVLKEANSGAWIGNVSNPNIQQMINVTGVGAFPVTAKAWCATFVGYMLKISGCPFKAGAQSSKVSTLAADYSSYSTGVNNKTPASWRKGDIMVVHRPGGYHVAFLWGLTASNVVLLGGNQGTPSTVSAINWYSGTKNNVVAVRRGWVIPTELDTSLPNA